MFMEEGNNPVVFYDFEIIDTFMVFGSHFGDSLIKIYSLHDPLKPLKSFLKGSGPNDFISPLFNKSISNETSNSIISLYDLNMWKISKLMFNRNDTLVDIIHNKIPAGLPPFTNLNITEKYLYGTDIIGQSGMFFIWNKKRNQIEKIIPYYPPINMNYKELSIPGLYEGNLCVNEHLQTIAFALRNLNVILFYDLEGNMKKSVVIGSEILAPKVDYEYLNFSNDPKYFTHITGSDEFVYCLYNGTNIQKSPSDVFIFNWNGDFIKRLHINKPLYKIAASKDGNFIFGLSENEEGGSDVVKM
jgi:hypothetical protein